MLLDQIFKSILIILKKKISFIQSLARNCFVSEHLITLTTWWPPSRQSWMLPVTGCGSRDLAWRHTAQAPSNRWSNWVEGFNTNNDVPYPPNGHSGNIISIKDVIKSSLGESIIPNKQRLSVQFPVSRARLVVVLRDIRRTGESPQVTFRPQSLTTLHQQENSLLRILS